MENRKLIFGMLLFASMQIGFVSCNKGKIENSRWLDLGTSEILQLTYPDSVILPFSGELLFSDDSTVLFNFYADQTKSMEIATDSMLGKYFKDSEIGVIFISFPRSRIGAYNLKTNQETEIEHVKYIYKRTVDSYGTQNYYRIELSAENWRHDPSLYFFSKVFE